MAHITTKNLTKRFGSNVAVQDLNLEIGEGEFFSLLGPSGCGKTTTMRMIAGLTMPDEGRITIGDQVVFDSATGVFVPPAERKIGMVFQDYALWPHMTVGRNVSFGLESRKIPKSMQQEQITRVLKRLQIEHLADRYPNELSGGQQQRVALARELVTDARILLMDEPLSNLDAKLRLEMRVELKQIHEETSKTFMYVTHDQMEALTLSSKTGVMNNGRIQQNEHPEVVFDTPSDLFVARFIGQTPINELTIQLTATGLTRDGFTLPLPQSLAQYVSDNPGEVILAARPEELRIETSPDEWCVPARGISVLPMGYESLVRVHVATKDPLSPVPLTVLAPRGIADVIDAARDAAFCHPSKK
ncbi:MAG: ABC transporter ATP-binding protein [Spirochaeta sp.]|nr:ABC transporter ATP-binding protein [Spirochaeta sp.]